MESSNLAMPGSRLGCLFHLGARLLVFAQRSATSTRSYISSGVCPQHRIPDARAVVAVWP